jgi:arylsulfatase A-like enzyme
VRRFLPLLFVGYLLAHAVAAAAPVPRPNILLVLADDMRADSIGALGNRAIRTPHLDRLVARGLALTNAYCLGGNSGAVCTPSRNMLLSGQAFFRWGGKPVAPAGPPNVPSTFKDAGYLTYHHGKRHNTAPAIQALFDINKTLADDEGERLSGEPGKIIVDDAIAFLREQAAGPGEAPPGGGRRPFFMYLAPGNPHDPRVAAPAYLSQYRAEDLPLPRNYLPQHPFNNGEMTVRDEKLLPWPRPEADVRRTWHEYYATVTGLDYHLGRLLDTLDELGLATNTLVVFSADQGISIGSHGLLGKQNLYDHAMKVPLLLAGPGIARGRSGALVYLLDLYPTLCEAAGLPVPPGLDGRSFAPVLRRPSRDGRGELLLAYRGLQRAWRDERWKLIRYPEVNVTQLFDLRNDPDERLDLAGEPQHARRVRHGLDRLQALQAALGDIQPLSAAVPKPAAWQPPKPGASPTPASPRPRSRPANP